LSFAEVKTPTLLLPVLESLIDGDIDTTIACYGDTATRIPCTLVMGHGYTNPLAIIISYIDIIVTWMLGTQLCHVYTSRFHLTLVLHVHEAL